MAISKTITLPVPTDAEPQAVREVTLHELRIGTILDLLERDKDGTGTDPLAALSELLASGQVLTGCRSMTSSGWPRPTWARSGRRSRR
jgi:hypothetical protein